MQDNYPSRHCEHAAFLPQQEPVLHSTVVPSSPLDEDQLSQFERDGYILLPELFDADETCVLTNELDRLRHDPTILASKQAITEPDNGALRSLFQIHQTNDCFAKVARDPRIAAVARQILAGPVYIHQSRLNFKPGLRGKEFYWHSDFETWHSEDGIPRMRALSCSILLTDNDAQNGALMVLPGSHKVFLSCVGTTPENNYLPSLKKQETGISDDHSVAQLAEKYGIQSASARAGSVLFFDCNLMHGSNSNITPYPRSNLFFVYNPIDNQPVAPFCGQAPRPEFIATRKTITPIE